MDTTPRSGGTVMVHNPPLARLLFEDTRFGCVWLAAGLYLGYEWFHAGYEKVTNPAWLHGGTALKGYWTTVTHVLAKGNSPITYGW